VTIDSYITTYGYLAVMVGVFLEGELVVMTAGFLAHRQLLELHWVIGAALLGSLLTYQFFFYLGKTRGTRFLQRRPHWQARVEGAQALLERHHLWVTLGYRALIGFRAMTPFALGMTNLSQRRFLALDFLPALAWSLTFPCLGYFLGREWKPLLDTIERYQGWAAAGFTAAALLVLGATLLLRRRNRSPASPR